MLNRPETAFSLKSATSKLPIFKIKAFFIISYYFLNAFVNWALVLEPTGSLSSSIMARLTECPKCRNELCIRAFYGSNDHILVFYVVTFSPEMLSELSNVVNQRRYLIACCASDFCRRRFEMHHGKLNGWHSNHI